MTCDVPAANQSARSSSLGTIAPGLLLFLPYVFVFALVLLVPERASEFVALGVALAWPLAVMAAAVAFRNEIPELVRGLGGRIKGVTIPPLTLELVTVTEIAPDWTIPAPGNPDVRKLTPSLLFDSPTGPLFDQLGGSAGADFAVVDLGRGEDWVTTRLFIFAVVLERLRNLRCFVFLETTEQGRRQWFGVATPESVWNSLGGRYPWLRTALEATDSLNQGSSLPGTLDPNGARYLVQSFLSRQEIQRNGKRTPTPAGDWLRVSPTEPLYEHAHWLTGDLVVRILGGAIDQDSWVLDMKQAATEEAVLGRSGPYVGVVGAGCRFVRLLDRDALVEHLARRAIDAAR